MNPEVFFITGGCGFIGSNFIRYLLEYTDVKRVINLDKLTYAGNTSNLKEFDSDNRYVFIKGDIIDSKLVRSIFQNHNPDCLVHFAAESHVDRSIDDPAEFINTNIINGTVGSGKINIFKYTWPLFYFGKWPYTF